MSVRNDSSSSWPTKALKGECKKNTAQPTKKRRKGSRGSAKKIKGSRGSAEKKGSRGSALQRKKAQGGSRGSAKECKEKGSRRLKGECPGMN